MLFRVGRRMNFTEMVFSGWQPLARTLVVGVSAYFSMLTMVRISGPRTLAQLNAYDLIVTVALGSTLATVIVSSQVSLSQGLLAFLLLVLMQGLLSAATHRFRLIDQIVTGEPQLLVHEGNIIEHALARNRISRDAILATVRNAGVSTTDVLAVVLETNGKMSVITKPQGGNVNAIPERKS